MLSTEPESDPLSNGGIVTASPLSAQPCLRPECPSTHPAQNLGFCGTVESLKFAEQRAASIPQNFWCPTTLLRPQALEGQGSPTCWRSSVQTSTGPTVPSATPSRGRHARLCLCFCQMMYSKKNGLAPWGSHSLVHFFSENTLH